MSDQVEFAPRVRGIQERQVWEAADALLQEGLRPTIDRVRHKLGTGSPNTVAPMLERWFGTLGKRLDGRALVTPPPGEEVSKLPLNVLQLAEQLWDLSRREADQVQIQKTEATRRELELERNALVQRETELQQRETFFEQARVKVEEALAASKLQFDAMQAQMQSQLQESARMLSNSQAEERRLRKALDEAVASKEALREKAEMELGAKQRAADEAAERYLAHERRLHSEVDRERMATRQAKADLEKEQKARAVDAEASRSALASAKQALQEEKTAHRDAAAVWSRQHQEVQVELATLRERAAGAELRATDLASQLQHQLEQSKREIAQLRESHAATAAALRQLEARGKGEEAPQPVRFRKSSK
ncbi:DNA-binding protein [Variovorax sp. LjRoot175]|uniref:DNA-binding protein n=1 Tax=Variovorax sp. LjRoot175 TaxID=3342276 RepID=UPI003ECC7D05